MAIDEKLPQQPEYQPEQEAPAEPEPSVPAPEPEPEPGNVQDVDQSLDSKPKDDQVLTPAQPTDVKATEEESIDNHLSEKAVKDAAASGVSATASVLAMVLSVIAARVMA